MKAKYCSWDVRDLAADYGWSELTDPRDLTCPVFKSPPTSALPGGLFLSINIEAGQVTVYSEDAASLRNIHLSEIVLQFEQLEKLFQLDSSLIKQINTSKSDEPKEVSQSFSPSNDKSEDLNMDPLHEGNINIEAVGKILQRWDAEEKKSWMYSVN